MHALDPRLEHIQDILRKTHIVIPTYNERHNIVLLIEQIAQLYQFPSLNVWVADDSSPDGTAEAVAELSSRYPNVHVIVRREDRGYGRASLDGIRAALAHGAEYVVTMDADFSHEPATIGKMLAAIESFDVVIGSRYVSSDESSVENWSALRLAGSRCMNTYVRLLTGVNARDATSGFRCYRADVLRKVLSAGRHATGFAFLPETLFLVGMAGARITEVSNLYQGRTRGESKLNWKILLEYLWIPLRLRLSRPRN